MPGPVTLLNGAILPDHHAPLTGADLDATVPPGTAEPGGHSVYTRLRYRTWEECHARLQLAARTSIPAMIGQRRLTTPVRWVWLCHQKHRTAIEFFVRGAGWEGRIGWERNDGEAIQTVLDSDDWIDATFLADIQDRLGEKTQILHWHPFKLDLATGIPYECRRDRKLVSMFYTVFRPTPEIHVYARKHNEMQTLPCPVHEAREENRVALVVHGDNWLTTIKPRDRRLPVALPHILARHQCMIRT